MAGTLALRCKIGKSRYILRSKLFLRLTHDRPLRLIDLIAARMPKLAAISRISALRFAAIALSLGFSVLAARFLGAVEFGHFTVDMAAIGLFAAATSAGLPQLFVREVAAARGALSCSRLSATLQGASLLLGIGLLALGAAFFFLSSIGRLAGLLIVVSLPVSLLSAVLNGCERVEASAWVNGLLRPVIAVMALAALAALGYMSVESALTAQLVGTLICGAALSMLLRDVDLKLLKMAWQQITWRFTCTHRSVAKAGLHFGLIQLLVNATQQAEIFWLTWLATPRDVAHFFAATRAATAVSFFHASVLAMYTPTLIKLDAEKQVAARDQEIMRATKTGFLLTTLAALGAAVLSWPYLRAFGADFADAVPAMCLLLGGWMALSSLGPVTQILIMNREEAFVWVGMIVGIVAGGATAFVCIPPLGLLGAGVSFNVMLLGAHVVLLPKVRQTIGFIPFGFFRL